MNQNKPVSIVRDELVSEIVAAMDRSHLSYFVLEYVFKDLYNEIHNCAVRQAQAEKEAYLESTKPKSPVPGDSTAEAHAKNDDSVTATM